MKRRVALATLGGIAAGLTLSARAQEASIPVIGFLGANSPDQSSDRLVSFLQALKDTGYVDGVNVRIEYRWAGGHTDRFPGLVADLVRRHVAVIVAGGGTPSALAAKAATSTIPIVFETASEPIETGLVTNLNRPGGNLTGVTNLNVLTGAKRLELMHELLPRASSFGVLVDPTSPTIASAFSRNVHEAAGTLGLQTHVLQANSESDFDLVFDDLAKLHAAGLIIGPFYSFNAWTGGLAALTVRHRTPAIFQYRPFVAAGGLLSYGSSETEYFAQVGAYTGRILAGEKPADLPIQQARKIELFINLKTARALGITIPQSLLARADEVIQ